MSKIPFPGVRAPDNATSPTNPLKVAREKLEQAEACRRQGKLDQAEKICTTLLSQYPDYFAALHTLGMTYADKKQSARALGPLFQAVTLNPNSWMTLTALSGVCLNLNAGEMAADVLERARRLNPKEPAVLATLGLVYRQEREYERASEAFKEALKQEPNFLEASMGLVRCYISLGDDEGAAKIIRQLLKRGVRTLDLLSTITQFPAHMIDIDLTDELERIVAKNSRHKEEDQETLALIRAHAHDWAGRYEDAGRELKIANRIISEKLSEQLIGEKERQKYSLKWLEEGKSGKAVAKRGQLTTLFIFGPSRSGKTSLEKLVSTLDGVKRGFENNGPENAIKRSFQDAGLINSWSLEHLPQQFYPQFCSNFAEETNRRAGSAKVFTNTHPGYMQNVSHLARLVPNSRFMFVKRNVDDLTLRIYMRSYQSGNAYAYSLPTIRGHIAWYHKMMELMAEKFPDIVRIVNYEDMITDPNGVLKIAAGLCDIPTPRNKVLPIADDRDCAKVYQNLIG